MAANLKDDEERIIRVLMIFEYISRTHASTRETAKYFTEHFFSISNATVSEYMKRASKISKENKEKIEAIIKENKPKDISIIEVRDQILTVANYICEGYTIEQVADTFNSTYFSIYRDLTVRLKKIDEDLYLEVMEKMKQNRLNNLKQNQSKNR